MNSGIGAEQTLTNANTYSGLTTIAGGTLAFAGNGIRGELADSDQRVWDSSLG